MAAQVDFGALSNFGSPGISSFVAPARVEVKIIHKYRIPWSNGPGTIACTTNSRKPTLIRITLSAVSFSRTWVGWCAKNTTKSSERAKVSIFPTCTLNRCWGKSEGVKSGMSSGLMGCDRLQHKYFLFLMPFVCFVFPTVIPMVFWNETFKNAYCLNILRYVLCLHATWLVNSAAHMWGSKPYDK